MPSYVNIGAYVGEGTMVDTWATVGSCAQIGATLHLLGRRGSAACSNLCRQRPSSSRTTVSSVRARSWSRGAHVCREAVLGSNTVITGSTHIIDVTGAEPVEYRGYVPPRSVVIPGSYAKKFPAGEYSVACALIIGRRKESTDKRDLAQRRAARFRRCGVKGGAFLPGQA